MSMLVSDELHYREIGSCSHGSSAASPAYHVVTPEGSFFGFDWSYVAPMEHSIETETAFVR